MAYTLFSFSKSTKSLLTITSLQTTTLTPISISFSFAVNQLKKGKPIFSYMFSPNNSALQPVAEVAITIQFLRQTLLVLLGLPHSQLAQSLLLLSPLISYQALKMVPQNTLSYLLTLQMTTPYLCPIMLWQKI